MHFKKHVLSYTIWPLLILLVGSSYFKFIILQDFTVSYEGFCDPLVNSCFIECEEFDENDKCLSEYFYTYVEREASDLNALCGKDITDCPAADTCTVTETKCSITYCDPDNDIGLCLETTNLNNNNI